MYTLFTVLIIIASVLLGLIVLVQNSKGGGLVAGFQSSNQMLGVRKTTDFLEKATWVLAIAIVVLSIAASISIPAKQVLEDKTKSMLDDQIENWQTQQMPALPSPAAQPAKKKE